MTKEQLAHELTMLYLLKYDDEPAPKNEGAFVGRYVSTRNRIIAALPDEH